MKGGSRTRLLCPVNIGDAEGLFDVRTKRPSGDHGKRTELPAQTRAARMGIDTVWTGPDIQAEALMGMAEQ
jgi:hypothetical protein